MYALKFKQSTVSPLKITLFELRQSQKKLLYYSLLFYQDISIS